MLGNLVVRDLVPASNETGSATLEVGAVLALNPEVPEEIVTTCLNNEETDAINVELSLGTKPEGWTVFVKKEGCNLSDGVARVPASPDRGQLCPLQTQVLPPASSR